MFDQVRSRQLHILRHRSGPYSEERQRKATPTIHWQPMARTEGEKGCGGCHKIGDKSLTEIVELRDNGSGTEFGAAQCEPATRATLSRPKRPVSRRLCETCHMGFDHPQWEMYSASLWNDWNGILTGRSEF